MNKLGIIVFGLGVIGAIGCGKKGSEAKGTGLAIDAAAVNSLVPAPLKDKLVFEKRDIVLKRGRSNTTYTLAAPKGWEQRMNERGPPSAASSGGK